MMKRNKMKGFTLVELLAVIVILAIILIIAVPQIMNTIKDTKKASLESSAKMVAAQVENQYTVAKTLSKEFGTTGSCMQDWAGLNNTDYESCTYEITSDGSAKVTLVGKGKFNNLKVENGTRSNATAVEGETSGEDGSSSDDEVTAVSFANDDWSTIVAAVQSGTYPYQVGDTKTVDMNIYDVEPEHYTIRVANTTPCSEVEVESQTACGFVLEFVETSVYEAMYIGGIAGKNLGGWQNARARTFINNSMYNALPEDLRNGIIDTYVVSSHGSEDSGELANGNFGSTDKLYLLSPQEVFGIVFEAEDGVGELYTEECDSSNGTSRQLDYYEENGVSAENSEGATKGDGDNWWLRSAISENNYAFYSVWDDGILGVSEANSPICLYPAFRLAN